MFCGSIYKFFEKEKKIFEGLRETKTKYCLETKI